MRQTLKPSPKPGLKLKLFPGMDLDLKILQAPRQRLADMARELAEDNPVIELGEIKPATTTDAALNEYLSTGDDGRAEESFAYDPEENDPNSLIERLVEKPETLIDHLTRQLCCLDLTPERRALAETIIGNISANGFLGCPLADIAEAQATSLKDAEKILSLIQTFDPAGTGARDLRECLLLQLKAKGRENSLAFQIIDKHLALMEKKQFARISRALQTTQDAVKQAAAEIAALEPKPGLTWGSEPSQALTPDAWVKKTDDGLEVIMNTDDLPPLSINQSYLQMLNRKDAPPEDLAFIRDRVQAARSLMSAIKRRQTTLRAITEAIVTIQRDHLSEAAPHPCPMTLEDVARIVQKDSSTVSRAIDEKYLATPLGIIPLRSLFQKGIVQEDQRIAGPQEIKEQIQGIIALEDKASPLSDQAIAAALKARNIHVSRRAVTQYRETLNIPPSLSRRQ